MAADHLIAALKKQVRRDVLQRLRKIPEVELGAQSLAVYQAVSTSDLWKSARHVALFYSTRQEIQTHPLLKQAFADGKRVYLPRAYGLDRMVLLEVFSLDDINGFDLNAWGVREPQGGNRQDPMATGRLDVIYIPGLAFDSAGNRLGYGKGYYDKWLHEWRRRSYPIPTIVGICLKEQLLKSVPVDDHDVRCDIVVHVSPDYRSPVE